LVVEIFHQIVGRGRVLSLGEDIQTDGMTQLQHHYEATISRMS